MIKTTKEQLERFLSQPEGENLEFKQAKNSFSESNDLPDYCAALANEEGGKLILGVHDSEKTPDRKRKVVGSEAFKDTHTKLSIKLYSALKIRIDVEELFYKNKRVLIFHVPSRPKGQIIQSTGKYRYPMRAGASLVEMSSDQLKKMLTENEPDFSAEIVRGVEIKDVDVKAVKAFQELWSKKPNNPGTPPFNTEKTLRRINAMTDKGITRAGLILFGRAEKISEFLPCSEVCFEWRQDFRKISHDYRRDWRGPFFLIMDEIWDAIDARNIRFPFQQGLFQGDIMAFDKEVIREALLNAVTHRDYHITGGSIFIKASPQSFSISSPGGFVAGITPENIFTKSLPRNRLIAEIFQFAGLVERSGQGMDKIFRPTIAYGKGSPSFDGSDDSEVKLTIPAQVEDIKFVAFIEKVTNTTQEYLSFEEMRELELLRKSKKVKTLQFRKRFLELGIVEQVGNTKGAFYTLSPLWYEGLGAQGEHTRVVGLSRSQNKELILEHLRRNKKGAVNNDFRNALKLPANVVRNILMELKQAGKIRFEGSKKAGRWFIETSEK
ncbi:MAG: putative DNA binding domain-containing protein [Deltaproteobacteria bacterium]|nr:putative DNA binding domain-containing protein [Deltaproteobacteria bacterium]